MNTDFHVGNGRLKVELQAISMGDDLVIRIYNEKAHIGAVAIGEYDFSHSRASVSVITRLGHKDDALAQKAAYTISKELKKTVCVIAGVHLDDILPQEIIKLQNNSLKLIDLYLKDNALK